MAINSHEIRRINALPLFAGVPPQALTDILSEGVVRVEPRGALLFSQGDPVDHFFVVLSGWVRLYRMSPDGHATTLEIFGPGESFAEGAMLMQGGYPASAEMIATGRLLRIPTRSFIRRLRAEPELALNMLTTMAIRLKGFTSRLESLATLSAPQRVATFLLRYCEPSPDGPASAVISLPYDKRLIASRLGMTPETLSRAFRRLREAGVTVHSNKVRIDDIRTLQDFATPK